MPAEIEVVVSKDGKVTLEVKGVVGPGCLDLARAIEEALGTVESRECKVDYYEEAKAGQELAQREG